jgi:hypothetical protein
MPWSCTATLRGRSLSKRRMRTGGQGGGGQHSAACCGLTSERVSERERGRGRGRGRKQRLVISFLHFYVKRASLRHDGISGEMLGAFVRAKRTTTQQTLPPLLAREYSERHGTTVFLTLATGPRAGRKRASRRRNAQCVGPSTVRTECAVIRSGSGYNFFITAPRRYDAWEQEIQPCYIWMFL